MAYWENLVASTEKAVPSSKVRKTPSAKNQKEAASTSIKNQKEALSTSVKSQIVPSVKNQQVLTASQKVLATVQKVLATKIYSTPPIKSQKVPSSKANSTITKSQKLLSKTQKAHSKVQKSVSNKKKIPSTSVKNQKETVITKGQKESSSGTAKNQAPSTTTNRPEAPPTVTRVAKLLTESATLPSAATFKVSTCTPRPVKPRTPLSELTGYVTVPHYAFYGSPYSSAWMFRNRASCINSVKGKDPYSLKGANFGILPHFRSVKRKRKSSKDRVNDDMYDSDDSDDSEDSNYNDEFHGNGKAIANGSPLREYFLPASRYVFPVKRMHVSVEEFVPSGNTDKDVNVLDIEMDTNVDTNKDIKGNIKEGMKKEMQKHDDLIELTPPPPPLFSKQLTFKKHILEQPTDQQEDPPCGTKPQLRPSSVQAEIDSELEVLAEKEKVRLENLQISKWMARKENKTRRTDLRTFELREKAEERKRSQDIEEQCKKKKKQEAKKRNKARKRERRNKKMKY
ncbi:hypothetical protein HPULCUR_011970 [Helicostylum pulchrum]|uniref:Uncharacterized protein n=1 Tax=Helicostylum pulchrum TaxID=562976 RepID=A0ABP9YHM8_9FUNG